MEKLVTRRLFLNVYLILNEENFKLRACLGNPGAIQVLDLDRHFRQEPTTRHYKDLHIALNEYRRALLN